MGQYYKAVVLNNECKKENTNEGKVATYAYSFDCGEGQKLMEHSYVGDTFVNVFSNLIYMKDVNNGISYTEDGKFAGLPVVWAGDYADYEDEKVNGQEVNIYDLCDDKVKLNVTDEMVSKNDGNVPYKYFVNLDDMEFVNLDEMIEYNVKQFREYGSKEFDIVEETVHPLPLLTCEGNGRGGGDYDGDSMEYIGRWARKRVVATNVEPDASRFKEIKPKFVENYIKEYYKDINKF